MNEVLRRQYLAVLGIQQWLPRDAGDDALAAVVAETAAASIPAAPSSTESLSTAPLATAEVGVAETVAVPPVPATVMVPHLLAEAASVLSAVPPPSASPSFTGAPQPQSPALPLAAQQAATKAASMRLGCSLLLAGDGLLLLAEFSTPDAAGLSGAEYEMLANIAAALAPGRLLPDTLDFSWPPAGVQVPGMDHPDAAAEALLALLMEQRKRGVCDVLVLGKTLGDLLQAAPWMATLAKGALSLTCVPALAVMLLDPDAKRACWDMARPLRRPVLPV